MEAYARRLDVPEPVAAGFIEAAARDLVEAGVLEELAPPPPACRRADPEAMRPPAHEGTYLVGDRPLRVRVACPEVAAMFVPLAAPALLPAAATSIGGPRLDLRGPCPGYVVLRDGEPVREAGTATGGRWALAREMVLNGWARRRWLALLHAAAVEAGPGSALLLAGDSGSGKTTLTAGLVASGLPLLSDDIVPVAAGDLSVRPVPYAMSVKRGSWPVVRALLPGAFDEGPVARVGPYDCRFVWPPCRAAAGRASGPRARLLLFPSYVAGAALEVEPVGPMDVVTALGESGSILPHTRDGLADLCRLVREMRAYRMRYGDLDAAVGEAARLGREG